MGNKETLGLSPKSLNALLRWAKGRSTRAKVAAGFLASLVMIVVMRFTVNNSSHFYLLSESCHAAGILLLIRKLMSQKSCSGLSVKTQELTAIFLVARFICSTNMEKNIHTVLDLLTLFTTGWVIYMMRWKLKSSYSKDMDTLPIYYVLVPCAILSLLVHPPIHTFPLGGPMFAFCIYVEALSVLPQLRLMQRMKMIEPFTAKYVFALGVARFFAWTHWIIQTYETRGAYFFLIGNGYFWFFALFLAEVVQSFILVDFCYYYIRSFARGQYWVDMPV
ncbi:hypothetical protein MLD38_025168 [Melastoma candidum]|uniref:Uncharacterized protein n=1 Tax=Melastoma candidum TaxID=119954 RepID=A0ACB9NU79_9MYRT|nr:hypothetical protein MLD38_025168 [Melastoma candidum]